MRFVTISDTHNQHWSLNLPEGDVLVHAGDFSFQGRYEEYLEFGIWLEEQVEKFKHIVVVSGNHDFLYNDSLEQSRELIERENKNVHWLYNETIEIEGIKIWGSPHTPYFMNWAFNNTREELNNLWNSIPEDIDIVITHGPPHMIGDEVKSIVSGGKQPFIDNVGCESLRETLLNRVKPKYHICGHIHESRGSRTYDGIRFINASVLDDRYKMMYKPLNFWLTKGKEQ